MSISNSPQSQLTVRDQAITFGKINYFNQLKVLSELASYTNKYKPKYSLRKFV